MNFQAAASMMSPPMSPARKNAKDPDKPKVLDLDFPWKKLFVHILMPKKFSGWSHSLYLLTSPFHFVRFLFRFPFLTSHIASWTEAESDWKGASFKPRFSFPSFPAIQTHLSFTLAAVLPVWVKSVYFCRFFLFFSVTIKYHHNHYQHYHLIPRPQWLKICFVSILRLWYNCSQENPNCSVQWTGSCFLPKSSVSNWSNSTQAKTTGEGTFHHHNFWPITNTKHILKEIPSSK